MRGAVAVAAGSVARVAAALVTTVWVAAAVRLAATWIAVARVAATRVAVTRVAAGLVSMALMAVPGIGAGRVAPAGLADVLRVGRPGRTGPLARIGADGPGVFPGRTGAACWPALPTFTGVAVRCDRLSLQWAKT